VVKTFVLAGRWWLTPVILATQKAEIRRITFQSKPGQIVHETLSRNTLHKNRGGGVAQGEGPEFKPQYWKKKKNPPWFSEVLKSPHLLYYVKDNQTGKYCFLIRNKVYLLQ
jgi:hypothetical protein